MQIQKKHQTNRCGPFDLSFYVACHSDIYFEEEKTNNSMHHFGWCFFEAFSPCFIFLFLHHFLYDYVCCIEYV